MTDLVEGILSAAKLIQQDADKLYKPPEEGVIAKSEYVLIFSVVKGTRRYIERVVHQINNTYEHGSYDACAVMIRRLLETLIIEAFEKHGIANKIKNGNGDFYFLRDLITYTLAETAWNMGRRTKSALPKLKDIGDLSAHSRRYNAQFGDIDKVIPDIRIVVQELIDIAQLK